MKNLDTLDHIAVQVNNIEKSLSWYIDNFSCEEIYSDETWAFIQFKNLKLALVSNNQHPNHFAILDNKVDNKGSSVKHRDGSSSVYIKDIDGNYIELICYNNK